jgi:hypothetical protein
MSFSSFERGTGGSGGAADYPPRTMERDERQRLRERELSKFVASRAEGEHDLAASERESGDEPGWLIEDQDSPLFLHNIPDWVLDAEAHLSAIEARLMKDADSLGRLKSSEVTEQRIPLRVAELRSRLTTYAEMDAEQIKAQPRRGRPTGETRTHYVWLISPDRDISNKDFKSILNHLIEERFPQARLIGYIHRDTDNPHLHMWLSALQADGRKLHFGKEKQRDEKGEAVWVDKFKDLDESVARAVSDYFGEPAIYAEHIAKKEEWYRWKGRFNTAVGEGARPPVMPFRARHDYDYIAEKIAIARREKDGAQTGGNRTTGGAPVPRCRSTMGVLELWGKTALAEERVTYRRELLRVFDAVRGEVKIPVRRKEYSLNELTRQRQRFQSSTEDSNSVQPEIGQESAEQAKHLAMLEEEIEERLAALRIPYVDELNRAEFAYQQYKAALDKTLENRARKGLPEFTCPLHNSRQIVELREMAELTQNSRLLRYVHAYEMLDKPVEAEKSVRVIGEKWRDQITGTLEVYERGHELEAYAQRNYWPVRDEQMSGIDGSSGSDTFNPDLHIVRGWLDGNWTPDLMRSSLACFEHESTRFHAVRYLSAREYVEATREVLADYRRGAEDLMARPAFDEKLIARVGALLEGEDEVRDEMARAYLTGIADYLAGRRTPGLEKFRQLIEHSLPRDAEAEGHPARTRDVLNDLQSLRPHDEQWMARLIFQTQATRMRALATAVESETGEKYAEVRGDALFKRDLLELAGRIRSEAGLKNEMPVYQASNAEQRELEENRSFVLEEHDWSQWTEKQIRHIKEFTYILQPQQRKGLEHKLGQAELKIEKEERATLLKTITTQLDSASQFYIKKVYQAEGLEALRHPEQFAEHVGALTTRYLELTERCGQTLDRLGWNEDKLKTIARQHLTDANAQYEQKERELRDLLRLEAKMILASELKAVSADRRERFENHYYFVQWEYKTRDGWESMSLAEVLMALHDRQELARGLIAREVAEPITREIEQTRDQLREEQRQKVREAETATRQFEAALGERDSAEIDKWLPIFTVEELKRLEECAVRTRNAEVIKLINQIEEAELGPREAVRRSLGRALAARMLLQRDDAQPAGYEHPLEVEKLATLPPRLHAVLSEELRQHSEARVNEKSNVFGYHKSLEQRSTEQARSYRERHGESLRPLLSASEGKDLSTHFQSRDMHGRLVWERRLKDAQVLDPDFKGLPNSVRSARAGDPSFAEWQVRTMTGVPSMLTRDHARVLSKETFTSQGEAHREIERTRSRTKSHTIRR